MYAYPETKGLSTSAPFVSFQSAMILKSFLVRSKFYPLEEKSCSPKCNGRSCQVCLSINEIGTYESFQTKQICKINHHSNYSGKCLINLLSCKVCGLQYVGSPTDKFCLLWNSYKENDRNTLRGEEHMQPKLFEHFADDKHNCFLNYCSITMILKQTVQVLQEEKSTGERSCNSLWAKYFELMVTSTRFMHFSKARVFNVKHILSNLSCVFCKVSLFFVLYYGLFNNPIRWMLISDRNQLIDLHWNIEL